MTYLLDTNTVSDLIRNPKGKAAARLAGVDRNQACISAIVAAELCFGAEDKNSPRLSKRVQEFLSTIRLEPFDHPAYVIYGTIRSLLKKIGRPIGPNDLFIAAHALALGSILVTDNEQEFSRVPGLTIENWLR